MERKSPRTPLSLLVLAGVLAPVLPAVPSAPSRTPQPGIELSEVEGPPRLVGRVVELETGHPLPARVVVRRIGGEGGGEVVASRYTHLPGIFTDEKGGFELSLPPGAYSLEVHHGLAHLSEATELTLAEGSGLEARVMLERWVPLEDLGWFNGDGHAHLYTDTAHDDGMLDTVRRICRAQGVDFLAVCQGWAGYDDDGWREGYAAFSDAQFRLYYGAEMPKYRTGHTFWLGLESTRGYFDAAMDTTYENEYYQVARNPTWTFESLPFPVIPDVELVPRFKDAQGAAAIVPHPTSWWWQERDGVEKYTTNVAGHLAFGLLAGRLWDGLVVMGYDDDHYFYQNLWFHVLNEGYRMTPVAELDGGFEPGTRFPYGSKRTYFQTGPALTIPGVVDAVRSGRTFVTSGPVVLARIDARYDVGDVAPADGTPRTLRIRAFASADREDHLTYVVLFRNGRIHEVWDLRDERPRRIEKEVALEERENAWYVIKAYGRNSDRPPEALDVMKVCDDIVAGRPVPALPKDSDIALTSPFYFRREGAAEPGPLRSRVRLTVQDPVTGEPVREGQVAVQLLGRTLETLRLDEGRTTLTMPVNALLLLDVPGSPRLRRSLYLDYPPYRTLLERLAAGRWLEEYGGRDVLQPGQVPWEAFHLTEAREVLSDVEWTVVARPNERDGLWEDFEVLLGAGRGTSPGVAEAAVRGDTERVLLGPGRR